ncbi:hypothetical protein [Flavobacterium sp.]|uniref:hypothetical protein n=1 Tax=Flavobacterium sp. TaxID=239 RepID=UPI003D6BEF36
MKKLILLSFILSTSLTQAKICSIGCSVFPYGLGYAWSQSEETCTGTPPRGAVIHVAVAIQDSQGGVVIIKEGTTGSIHC